jgi:uncharacterized membrane protein
MGAIYIIPVIGAGIGLLLGFLARKNRSTFISEAPGKKNALQILDERFARGEIDEMEYIRKKDMLKH